jgi:hypothetical protein
MSISSLILSGIHIRSLEFIDLKNGTVREFVCNPGHFAGESRAMLRMTIPS